MLEVLLDLGPHDGDLTPTHAEGATDEPPEPTLLGRVGRSARRHRVLTVGVTIALVGAYASAVVAEDRNAAARREQLAVLDALLPPLDSAPHELWRLDLQASRYVAVTGGMIIGLTDQADELFGVDTATGRTTWHTTLPGATLTTPGGDVCSSPVDDTSLLACAFSGTDGTDGTGAGLVVLDVRDGHMIAQRQLDRTPVQLFTAGTDVVLVLPGGGASGVQVRREDAATGSVRWTVGPGGASTGRETVDSPTVGLEWSLRGGVLVGTGHLTVAVDLTTGEALDTWADLNPLYGSSADRLPDGGWVTWVESGATDGAVRNADGTVRFSLEEAPPAPQVDDRSADEVLLAAVGSTLHGVDVRTGTDRWTTDGPCGTGEVALRLEGTITCIDHGLEATVVAQLDLTSGRELWRISSPPSDAAPVITDGHRLILVEGTDAQGGPRTASSRRLTDGSVEWQMTLPDGATNLWALDHRLYTLADNQLIRLG
jgi:hypothetical protein